MAIIKLNQLYKIYHCADNEVHALDGISLQIENGEYVAIIGSSGSGKSTLMNMIGCLDRPTDGQYYFNNMDVSNLNDNRLSQIRNKEIGFIFQSYNLIGSLSALENVELPLMYRKLSKAERRKAASEALKIVGMENRMHHRPSQLSGGQQQRVAIARAIASQPSVILADEPTGNLDSSSGRDVTEIIERLNKDGKTVVIITHDNEMAQRANRIIRIKDGQIIEDIKQRQA